MKIKLIMDSPSLGRSTRTIEVQSNISEDDIKALYILYFGVCNPFCSYEKIEEGE
jgi:hypothetical protein